MQGLPQLDARSTAQLYSQTALPPVSPETWRSLRNSPSPTRTGRRFYSPTARPEPGTLNHLLSPPVIDPVLGAPPEALGPQFDLAYEACAAFGWSAVSAPGFEADDIIDGDFSNPYILPVI